MTGIEIDFSYANLPREKVVEWVELSSGRIVAMTDQESFLFEPDGTSPKGSYLVPWPSPSKHMKQALPSRAFVRRLTVTMKKLRFALGQALALIHLLEEGNPPENINQIKREIRAAAEGRLAPAAPDADKCDLCGTVGPVERLNVCNQCLEF